jgi:hypothetical protein
MNAPRDASFDDYMDAALRDPAEAAAYIDAMLELDDPAVIRRAMERTLKAQTELLDLIGEAYQVVGILADECGRFDDPHVIKMMDNLAAGQMVHADVLPFPSKQHNTTECHGENIPTQSPVAPAAI